MKVLLLGSGGREHALAWKIAQSRWVEHLYIMPGNPGTALLGTNLTGNPNDFRRVREVVAEKGAGMVVVGPEEPLVRGIHDFLLADPSLSGLMVVGPPAAGAMLEGSKQFAKEFMMRHNIPTARFRSFFRGQQKEARLFLKTLSAPYVLKADGLAAGKGVSIYHDLKEACLEADQILLHGKFGQAGEKLVIEEYLDGIEISVFILTDGTYYLLLPEAKDYKRIGEGDTGPNTGGMGSLSPVSFFDQVLKEKVETRIIQPTLRGLAKEGIPYSGFIFFGLMIVKGEPFMIEYNVRMGDPEGESVIPRIDNDLVELFVALKQGDLGSKTLVVKEHHAATVMLVSHGYPGAYEKGKLISGADGKGDYLLFHAGTAYQDGQLVTAGGRVLGVTALRPSMGEALSAAYVYADNIRFEGKYFRSDLGFDVT